MTPRRAAATSVVTFGAVLVTCAIGNTARGPYAEPSAVRDLSAGAAVVAAVALLSWAARELQEGGGGHGSESD